MSDPLFLDNDVIIKLCKYSLAIWEQGCLLAEVRVAAATSSKHVLPRQIARSATSKAQACLKSLLARMDFIEPDQNEIALAAKLELLAQRSGLLFDSGESQILALMVQRQKALFATSDKRAICSIAELQAYESAVATAVGRIGCIEQLFLQLLSQIGGDTLRAAICSAPTADRTLSICFCCSSAIASDERYREGLRSYLSELRERAGPTLVPGDFLLTIPSKENCVR